MKDGDPRALLGDVGWRGHGGPPKVKTGRTTWSRDPAAGYAPGRRERGLQEGLAPRCSQRIRHSSQQVGHPECPPAGEWRTGRGASTRANILRPQNETSADSCHMGMSLEDTRRRGRSHRTSTGPTHSRPPGAQLWRRRQVGGCRGWGAGDRRVQWGRGVSFAR